MLSCFSWAAFIDLCVGWSLELFLINDTPLFSSVPHFINRLSILMPAVASLVYVKVWAVDIVALQSILVSG